jgi:branched-chain amino acid transport system permease protein
MSEIFQQFLNVLFLASIYCLIAAGLSLIYGIMEIPNFAQGNIYALGAYLVYFLTTLPVISQSFLLVSMLAVLSMGLLGIVIDLLCFRPLKGTPHVNYFVVALGLLMFLEGLIVILFGPDYKEVRPPIEMTFSYGDVTISFQRLLVILGTAIVLAVLYLFIKRTKWGAMLEAMSQNHELAATIGINLNRMSLIAFMISTALAGFAGVIISPVSFVYPEMGGMPLLIAFAAIIFGGMSSLGGAVLGAFIMAFVQVFSTQYISEVMSSMFIFGIMIIALIFKPEGLMGAKRT